MKNPDVNDHLTRSDGLATRLRKARGNLTMTEFAERAGWGTAGKSKISKIEAGKQMPSDSDLETWAAIADVDERLLEQWKAMLIEAEGFRADYQKRMRQGQRTVQQEYTDLAVSTTRFRFFETCVVPRYLQIREYTVEVLREYHEDYARIDDIEAAADERQSSVRHLYDATKNFVFLLDEGILRGRRFPPRILRPQLDRLQSAIGLRNVRLGIYPSLSLPVKRLARSSFELFDDIGYIETALSDGPRLLIDDVTLLDRIFERLWEDAVEGDEARRLILDAVAALPGE